MFDPRRRQLFGVLGGAASTAFLASGSRLRAANGSMASRAIPSTGEPLPVVGLGTWQSFDVGGDEAAREPLCEVMGILFEAGGTVIDSSPMYGRSEAVAGDLAVDLGAGARPFFATKVWTRGRTQGEDQMARSYSRFHTDVVDLMQVHNLVDWQIHLETLRAWKEEGRIRYLGVTHYTTAALDDLARLIETQALDFVQLAYSIGVPDAARRVLPLAADRGVAVLVNRPYEGGAVFHAVRGRPLPDWAADFDCASWGQFFLKYILGNPAVTCVIPGTSKPRHMADNVAAGFGRLPDAAGRRRMEALWAAL